MTTSIFSARLQSLALKATKVDEDTFPRVHAVHSDGTVMNHEERNMLCIGQVITSLCGGITHNLNTPGAASTPQSVASIKAALRWAMSFTESVSQLDQFYAEIQTDKEYVANLFTVFEPMTLTSLVGTIASFGIGTVYPDGMYCTEQLSRWAYSVCVNILAFCAARDINPFD